MRTRQNAVLAALLRVQRFLAEFIAQLSTVVDLTVASKRLDDVIASFNLHAVDQDAHNRRAKGETEKQRQLRFTLRTEAMAPIAEIARRNLRTVPEFKALQMPARSTWGAAFLASAKAMADAASIHKAALLERGLPADFLDQFHAVLTQFEASVSEREKIRTRRIGATKGLLLAEQEGRSALKVLDGLVRRAVGANQALLAIWIGARTIHRVPAGASTTASSPSQATPTGTPVSSPTTPVAPAA